MSDRLSAICLALLLAAPLCFSLDGEFLEQMEAATRDLILQSLSREALVRNVKGLQDGSGGALAAN